MRIYIYTERNTRVLRLHYGSASEDVPDYTDLIRSPKPVNHIHARARAHTDEKVETIVVLSTILSQIIATHNHGSAVVRTYVMPANNIILYIYI